MMRLHTIYHNSSDTDSLEGTAAYKRSHWTRWTWSQCNGLQKNPKIIRQGFITRDYSLHKKPSKEVICMGLLPANLQEVNLHCKGYLLTKEVIIQGYKTKVYCLQVVTKYGFTIREWDLQKKSPSSDSSQGQLSTHTLSNTYIPTTIQEKSMSHTTLF